MKKKDMLRLPVSTENGMILMYYLNLHWDIEILYKTISEYFFILPLCDVETIIGSLETRVDGDTFQTVLDYLFSVRLYS